MSAAHVLCYQFLRRRRERDIFHLSRYAQSRLQELHALKPCVWKSLQRVTSRKDCAATMPYVPGASNEAKSGTTVGGVRIAWVAPSRLLNITRTCRKLFVALPSRGNIGTPKGTTGSRCHWRPDSFDTNYTQRIQRPSRHIREQCTGVSPNGDRRENSPGKRFELQSHKAFNYAGSMEMFRTFILQRTPSFTKILPHLANTYFRMISPFQAIRVAALLLAIRLFQRTPINGMFQTAKPKKTNATF